eukprot:1719947-Pyramimonas_sp.AAC.1
MKERGDATSVLDIWAARNHHNLHVAWVESSGLPVVYCLKCGAFTTCKAGPKLRGPCDGKASSESRKLKRRILPGTGLPITNSVALPPRGRELREVRRPT